METKFKNDLRNLVLQNANKPSRQVVPTTPVTSEAAFHAIARKAGFLQRWWAEQATSRKAADHFCRLSMATIDADAEVATAALTIAKTQLLTTILASATTTVGAQLVDLDTRASAVQQRLSTASGAEQIGHLRNRTEIVRELRAMAHEGDVMPEELSVLVELAQTDALENIGRARRRNRRSQQAIDKLHGMALAGVVPGEIED